MSNVQLSAAVSTCWCWFRTDRWWSFLNADLRRMVLFSLSRYCVHGRCPGENAKKRQRGCPLGPRLVLYSWYAADNGELTGVDTGLILVLRFAHSFVCGRLFRLFRCLAVEMAYRLRLLTACFAGCVAGSLVGLWLMIKFDAPIFALIAAGFLPSATCWLTGLRDLKQLAKISLYSTVGWALTFALQPAVAQSAASHAQRIAGSPLVGREWHIPASVVSTLLALIGVAFSPPQLSPKTSNRLPPDM
jgi:hypothetical protein